MTSIYILYFLYIIYSTMAACKELSMFPSTKRGGKLPISQGTLHRPLAWRRSVLHLQSPRSMAPTT